MEAKAEIMFEVSWEVCNKVGGIYTVVTSKLVPMTAYYKDNYFAIGPYLKGSPSLSEFQEKDPVGILIGIFEKLKNMGIICHVGKWLVDGEPNVILIDHTCFVKYNNDIKREYWEKFKIDSLGTNYYDYDDPMVWSTTAGILIEEFSYVTKGKKIIAHFHEWLAGGGLLHLKSKNAAVATVFTTHATMLGRTLAANHIDLYNVLDKVNPETEAYRYNIQAKFHTEKQCAANAGAFTTVSEITGIEATYLLGKTPDVLLPNGLDIEKFPTFEDSSILHKHLKGKIKNFLMMHFFPYYTFDLDNILVYFTAARYEFKDKGIDIFIKGLAKLNRELIEKNSDKTIIAFIWVPAFARGIRLEIIENRTRFEDIRENIIDMNEDIKEKLIYGIAAKKEINDEFILGDSVVREMKKKVNRFNREGLPPVCTHELTNENDNEIMNCIRESGLFNKKEDKVKIIYYPIYLTGADSLLDMTYYESIMGSHLGVFPSYYEPWGYTPLEAGALGVASLTTDLAGFGRYIEKTDNGKKNKGIFVLKRQNKKDEEIIDDLSSIMYNYTTFSKQDRIENKLKAKRIASMADWKLLIENYIKAHNMAVEKSGL
ncbi:MAG: glycosyltransferase [archaeon]